MNTVTTDDLRGNFTVYHIDTGITTIFTIRSADNGKSAFLQVSIMHHTSGLTIASAEFYFGKDMYAQGLQDFARRCDTHEYESRDTTLWYRNDSGMNVMGCSWENDRTSSQWYKILSFYVEDSNDSHGSGSAKITTVYPDNFTEIVRYMVSID